jgi:hypothetical protein
MASKYNVKLDQGSDYGLTIVYKDATGNAINLAGYTARMYVRTTYTTPTTIIQLPTENGMITIDSANGSLTLAITAANTTNLAAANSVYDLELVAGASVTRIMEGKFTVTPEVTK